MDHFSYRDGHLYCEEVSAEKIAQAVGTPAYVYSKRTLENHYDQMAAAFAEIRPGILFSVKSCANIHLLRLLLARGAGMDVVSGGELFRALEAGALASKVVFAGVGKTAAELRQALEAGVGFLNVESEAELALLEELARVAGKVANVAIRINPDIVDPRTHQHTTTGKKGSKFGVDIDSVPALFDRYGRSPHLKLRGLHFHLGSPLYSSEPYERAIKRTLDLVAALRQQGFVVDSLDIGGGFMADYGQHDARAPAWTDYAKPIVAALRSFTDAGGSVLMEPGRSISGNAGVLLTKVLYTKQSGDRAVAVVDTGMHHLIRPALYNAVQFMWPVSVDAAYVPHSRDIEDVPEGCSPWDLVGPICESTDRLAAGRKLPPLHSGDTLCIFSAGAYGMVMASQYNAVPRPPEILVDGDKFTTIRRRETYEDLVAAERGL